MRVLFLLFTLASTLTAFGQKLRFSYHGNHWVTGGLTPDCVLHGNATYDTLDTIFTGRQYLRLNDFINAYPSYTGSTCGGGRSYHYLIREDTINKYVYYRDLSFDTAERILYDYNLQPGDSIKYIRLWGTSTDSVVSIDSTMINGIWHRVLNMHNTGVGNWRVYSVIEGLGCTENPLFPVYFTACFEYEERLLCFSQDTLYPAINAPYAQCGFSMEPDPYAYTRDSFVNSIGCTILSADNTIIETTAINIYPNPATDHINITTNTSNIQASICNAVGQCMYTTSFRQNKEANINTTLWPAGLYIINIQNDGEILKREKIIIAN